jgi:hypothetical protein
VGSIFFHERKSKKNGENIGSITYLEHGKKKENFTPFLDDSKMTAKSFSDTLE